MGQSTKLLALGIGRDIVYACSAALGASPLAEWVGSSNALVHEAAKDCVCVGGFSLGTVRLLLLFEVGSACRGPIQGCGVGFELYCLL